MIGHLQECAETRAVLQKEVQQDRVILLLLQTLPRIVQTCHMRQIEACRSYFGERLLNQACIARVVLYKKHPDCILCHLVASFQSAGSLAAVSQILCMDSITRMKLIRSVGFVMQQLAPSS